MDRQADDLLAIRVGASYERVPFKRIHNNLVLVLHYFLSIIVA